MISKKLNVTYWIITILFVLFFLVDGVASMMQEKTGLSIILALGYPAYFMIINGWAKIIGALAILQNKYKTVKEWAYAGFTVNFIGASASHYYVGHGTLEIAFPIIFMAIMFVSYFLWKKRENKI